MWDLIISNAISGTVVLSGAIWYFKKYLNSYVDHEMHDLIEFALLVELKDSLEVKEDAASIARAKTIFEISADIKNSIKLKDVH